MNISKGKKFKGMEEFSRFFQYKTIKCLLNYKKWIESMGHVDEEIEKILNERRRRN